MNPPVAIPGVVEKTPTFIEPTPGLTPKLTIEVALLLRTWLLLLLPLVNDVLKFKVPPLLELLI